MEDLKNINIERIETEEFMNENDNFKEIELKNKIDNEIQNYNENILIPNDDTRLIDKNLLTCENMKSEINILGLETEGLYTPRELEENNFIEENLLAYEESKEITKESTSKNHSQFEYSIEKSVENSNSEMHLKTKPPKHRSNNNSHSSGFNKTSFTNHNYGKLRNDSNRSIKKKELGDSLDNISGTSKFKKIDDNSNKINRNLKNKTVTSEKTRNNNSLFDSKIVKRNTNENKSLDKAKSNLGSHKIINHTVSSKFGTPKNQVDQNRRSLELRKNNLDKISVEVKYKNPVINKIPKSNRVKENKDSKLVIFTKDSEKTIANKEFKLDNVISYLEDVFGLNFAENYEKSTFI